MWLRIHEKGCFEFLEPGACLDLTGLSAKWQELSTSRFVFVFVFMTLPNLLLFFGFFLLILLEFCVILNLIFDECAGGGPAEGPGLPPLQGGEGEDLLLQCHQILQPQDLIN